MPYDLKDEKEVEEYLKNLGTEYRFGCYSEKKPQVCHLLGDYLEAVSRDYSKAAKVYKENCDSNRFGLSCLNIGNYYYTGKGGLEKSMEKAVEYYEKGCSENEMVACFRAGVLSILNSKSEKPTKTLKEGVDYLTKSCNGKNKDACFHLSGIYINGTTNGSESITKDMTRAFQYAVRACELGHMQSCANVSIMYRKGEGVEQNQSESEKYKKLALEMKKEEQSQRGLVFQQGIK